MQRWSSKNMCDQLEDKGNEFIAQAVKALTKGNGKAPSILSPMQTRQLLGVDIQGFKKGGQPGNCETVMSKQHANNRKPSAS